MLLHVQLSSTAVVEEGPAGSSDEWLACARSLGFDEAVDTLCQTDAAERISRIMKVDCIAAMIRSGTWSEESERDRSAFVCLRLGIEHKQSLDMVRVATVIDERPCLRRAFINGVCDWSRFTLACQIARSGDEDASLAREIGSLSFNQLKTVLSRLQAVDPSKAATAHERRKLSFRHDDEAQATYINGLVPLDTGIELEKAIEARADTYAKNEETGEYPLRRHAMADALVDLLLDQAEVRTELLVDIDVEAFTGAGFGDLEGMAVSQQTLRRLACEGSIRPVLSRDGTTLGTGRATRLCPPWLSRLVRRRDRGCRFPGCVRTRHLHEHHMQEWDADVGPTNGDNIVLTCGTHHRFLHEGNWKIRGKPDADLEFINPDGRHLTGRAPAPTQQVIDGLSHAAIREATANAQRRSTQREQQSIDLDALYSDIDNDVEQQRLTWLLDPGPLAKPAPDPCSQWGQ